MPIIYVRVYKLQNRLDEHFMPSKWKIEAYQNVTNQNPYNNCLLHRFSAINYWSNSLREAAKSNFRASSAAHSDVLFNIFRFTAYPSTISDEDYQHLPKNSLPGQVIRRTTNFFMNFAKFK